MESKKRVKWVYSSSNNKELESRYDEWAKDYDKDVERDYEYKAPKITVEFFAKYIEKDKLILDAGAGTGLVGEVLSRLGFRNIVAIDMSSGMLKEASKKNVYTDLRRMVLGEPLDFPSNMFDAVICVGTLTLGHAPASSLEELVRITKSGGYIVFTLRTDMYKEKGFKELQDKLEQDEKWELIEEGKPFKTMPKGEPDVYHQIWVYKVK